MTHSSLEAAWAEGGAALGVWITSSPEFTLGLFQRAEFDYIGIGEDLRIGDRIGRGIEFQMRQAGLAMAGHRIMQARFDTLAGKRLAQGVAL